MTENALLYGIGLFVADTPWYVLASTPFLEEARVKKRTPLSVILVFARLAVRQIQKGCRP